MSADSLILLPCVIWRGRGGTSSSWAAMRHAVHGCPASVAQQRSNTAPSRAVAGNSKVYQFTWMAPVENRSSLASRAFGPVCFFIKKKGVRFVAEWFGGSSCWMDWRFGPVVSLCGSNFQVGTRLQLEPGLCLVLKKLALSSKFFITTAHRNIKYSK